MSDTVRILMSDGGEQVVPLEVPVLAQHALWVLTPTYEASAWPDEHGRPVFRKTGRVSVTDAESGRALATGLDYGVALWLAEQAAEAASNPGPVSEAVRSVLLGLVDTAEAQHDAMMRCERDQRAASAVTR